MRFLTHFFAFAFLLSMVACDSSTSQSGGNATVTENGNNSTKQPSANSAKAKFTGNVKTIGPGKTTVQTEVENVHQLVKNSKNPYVGYWVGSFGKNKINVILGKVADGKAEGFSVCAGNYRPLVGKYKVVNDNTYEFMLDEPGSDKYDGRFEFVINLGDKTCKGNWSPFEPDGNSEKDFVLKKQDFVYAPSSGDFSQTSQRLLKSEDLENLSAEELRLMRSEIYARHGYSFKEKDMRFYFENKDWYMPMSTDVREDLTDIETQNIDLIYEYEEYYEEYYDEYGR